MVSSPRLPTGFTPCNPCSGNQDVLRYCVFLVSCEWLIGLGSLCWCFVVKAPAWVFRIVSCIGGSLSFGNKSTLPFKKKTRPIKIIRKRSNHVQGCLATWPTTSGRGQNHVNYMWFYTRV